MKLRTLLIHPPLASPTGPPLSLAVVSAYLREKGHSVEAVDLNLESLLFLLEPTTVAKACRDLSSRIARFETKPRLAYSEQIQYRQLVTASAILREYGSEIGNAIKNEQDMVSFADPSSRFHAHTVINRVLNAVGVSLDLLGDAQLSPRDYRLRYSPFSLTDIAHCVDSSTESVFHYPFAAWLDKYDWSEIGVVGISVSYASQMIPAMILANEIRRRNPDVWIVFGGALAAQLNDETIGGLLKYCHAVVTGEGEMPMDLIVTARGEGRTITSELGVYCVSAAGFICQPNQIDPFDLSVAPTPDFTDFPLTSYITPVLCLPLEAGRGCYWGKCSFCNLYRAFPPGVRRRSAEQIANDIEILIERHGATHFEFVDDALSPDFSADMANQLLTRQLRIKWFCYSRFDPRFDSLLLKEMFRSGCLSIKFGLESASPKVLRGMRKGISTIAAARILSDAKDACILPQVGFFIGFPGETEKDRKQTLSFIENHVMQSGVISFNGWFRLLRGMPLHEDPKRFAIESITKWNTTEELIDYFLVDVADNDWPQYTATATNSIRTWLSQKVRHDLPTTVDLRRLFFMALEPWPPKGISSPEKITIQVRFDVSRIRAIEAGRTSDFIPGAGLRSSRSYIVPQALSDEALELLDESESTLERGEPQELIYIPALDGFFRVKGDEHA